MNNLPPGVTDRRIDEECGDCVECEECGDWVLEDELNYFGECRACADED